MEMGEKSRILKTLGTKGLVEKLHEHENKLDEALREEASFKDSNYHYLSSGTNDCPEVKRLLAELWAQAPINEGGRKLTEAEKRAWLERQRKENQQLAAAIARQKEVAFNLENLQINMEMARRRLEGTRAVLALRTAQIRFLSESD